MENRGIRLKRLRKQMGLTESDLSKYLKVDCSYIRDLENDTAKLNLTVLNKLSDLYCCDETYILCMSDEYEPLRHAFGSANITTQDLDSIAKVNQIYKNTKYLLEKEVIAWKQKDSWSGCSWIKKRTGI